ncbi:C40 family peptidase [Varibaculum massiliense]|uniref:C40 family peptidase n=1 Tax=Varibaculum massiliense TaxID=1852372 RepID=UPI0008DB04A0|nr:C40 family peptidase [Varibaculum massiliense]
MNPHIYAGRKAGRRALVISASFALAASASIFAPAAFASPADDKVNAAKAAESNAANSVAAIEAQLAQVNTETQNARDLAESAEASYNDAISNLVVAKQAAEKTAQDSKDAQEKVEQARKALAGLARTVYTTQGSLSSLTPYLNADGLQTVEMRKVSVELFGSKADAQMRTFDSISKVAGVLQERANTAKDEKEQAAQEVKVQKDAADQLKAEAESKLTQLSAQREELVTKLAEARGVTEQAEKERQEQIAAEKKAREEAAAQAALRAATQSAQQRPAARSQRRPAQATPRSQARSQSRSNSTTANTSGSRAAVVAYANRFLGVPYVWGGTTPAGFDCSGLVQYVYRNSVGIKLPRVSQAQRNVGTRVSRAQALPGDMVNYNHHVGIYLGDGYMIHAPKPRDKVRIAKVYGNPVYVRVL